MNLISESVNKIEWYFISKPIEKNNRYTHIHLDHMNVAMNKYSKLFGNPFISTFKEYIADDIVYTYDLNTDAQKVTRRIWKNDMIKPNMYVIAFDEENLPPHKFPCTNNISSVETTERYQYRINNRMYFNVDKTKTNNYIYINYNHSAQVDTDKMERDYQTAFQKIKSTISMF